MTTGRILIAGVDRLHALDLQQRISRIGHQVLAVAKSGGEAILVIIFVTYVAREAALRPRVSLQSYGDLQNFLVYARHVRHTCAW